MRTTHRFPFRDLERLFPATIEERPVAQRVKRANYQHLRISPISQIARTSGWDLSYLHKLRRQGLSDVLADRLAAACGFHPSEVWGELWWWTAPCPEPEPGGRFCGRHPQHKEREAA